MSFRDLYFAQYESPNIIIVPTLSFSSPPARSPVEKAADPITSYCEEIASVTDNICVPSGSNDQQNMEVVHTSPNASACTPEYKDHIRDSPLIHDTISTTPPIHPSQFIKELSSSKYKSRNSLVDLTGFNLIKMNNTSSLTKSKKLKQVDNNMKIGQDKIKTKHEKEHRDNSAHRDTFKPDKIINKKSATSVKSSSANRKENHDNGEAKENTVDMKDKMKKYFRQLWKSNLDKLEDKKTNTVKSSSRTKKGTRDIKPESSRSKANLLKLSKSKTADDLKNKITSSKKYHDLEKGFVAKYSERPRKATYIRHSSESKELKTNRKNDLSLDSIKRYKDFQRFTRLKNPESKYKSGDQNKTEKLAPKKIIKIKPCETITNKRDIRIKDERSSSLKHSVKSDKQSKVSPKQTDREIVKYHTNMERPTDQSNKKTKLIKSIVHVDKNSPEHSQSTCLNGVEDLRSKLSRKRTNSECLTHEPVKKKYDRENLVITVKQDVSPDSKKSASKTPNVNKPKTKKCKKIKLIINIECPNSDSDDSDEDSKKCPSPEDLSFLDDFNVDEIADSLNNSQVELNKVITTDNVPSRIVTKVIEKINNENNDKAKDEWVEENKPKDDVINNVNIKSILIKEEPNSCKIEVIEINSDTEDGDLNMEKGSVANTKQYNDEQTGVNNIADLNGNVYKDNTLEKTVDLCDNSNDSVVEVIDITEENKKSISEHSLLTGNVNSANLNKVTSNVDRILELLNRSNEQNKKSNDFVNTNDGKIKLGLKTEQKLTLSDLKDHKQTQLQRSKDPIEASLATMFNSNEQKKSVINTGVKADVIKQFNIINIKEEKEKPQHTEETVEASLETMFNNLEQNDSNGKHYELNRLNGCDKKAKSNSNSQKPVDVEKLSNKEKTEEPLKTMNNVVDQKILDQIELSDVNNKHIKIEPEYSQKSVLFNRESKILTDTNKNIIRQEASIEENAKVHMKENLSLKSRIISNKPLENYLEKRAHNKIVIKPLWNPDKYSTENTEQIENIEDAQLPQKFIQELERHDRIDMFEQPLGSENSTKKALTLSSSTDNILITHKKDIKVQESIKPLQQAKEKVQAKNCTQNPENKFKQSVENEGKNQKKAENNDAGKPTSNIERKTNNDKASLSPKNYIQEKLDCMSGSKNSSNEKLERAITILEKSLISFMSSKKPSSKSEEKSKTSFKQKHLLTEKNMLGDKAKYINYKTPSCMPDKITGKAIEKNTKSENTSSSSKSFCQETKKSIHTEKNFKKNVMVPRQLEINNAKIESLKKSREQINKVTSELNMSDKKQMPLSDTVVISKKTPEKGNSQQVAINSTNIEPNMKDTSAKTSTKIDHLSKFEDTNKIPTGKAIEKNTKNENTSSSSKSFCQETKKSINTEKSFKKNVMVPRQVEINNAKMESLKKSCDQINKVTSEINISDKKQMPLPDTAVISKRTAEKGENQQKAINSTSIEPNMKDTSAKTSTKIDHLPNLEGTNKKPTEKPIEMNTKDENLPSSKSCCQKTKQTLQIPKSCMVSPQVENNNAKIETSKKSLEQNNKVTSESNTSDKKKIPLLPLPNTVVVSKKSPEIGNSQLKPQICNIDSNIEGTSAKTSTKIGHLPNFKDINKKPTEKPIEMNTKNEKTQPSSKSCAQKTKETVQIPKSCIVSSQVENNNAKIEPSKKSLEQNNKVTSESNTSDKKKIPLLPLPNMVVISKKSAEIGNSQQKPKICTNIDSSAKTSSQTEKSIMENNKNTSTTEGSNIESQAKSLAPVKNVPLKLKTSDDGTSAKTSSKNDHLSKFEDTNKKPTEKSIGMKTKDEKTQPSSKSCAQKTKETVQIPKSCMVSPQVENNNAKIEPSKKSLELNNRVASESNITDKKKIPLLPIPNMVAVSKKSPEIGNSQKPKICTNVDSSAKTSSQTEKSIMENNKNTSTTEGSNIESQAKSLAPLKNVPLKLKTSDVVSKTEDSNIEKTKIDNVSKKRWEVVTESAEVEETEDDTEMNTTFKILTAKLQRILSQYLRTKIITSSTIRYGKFSTIFKYNDIKGDTHAVKVVHQRQTGLMIQEMLSQLQQYRSMEDTCVLYLFNGFDIQGRMCLFTEYFPKNLAEALRENKRSFHIDQVQHLSMQLVDAVNMLTNAGIIHSDIKPTHILLNGANDRLKLCGFDRATYAHCSNITPDTGTPSYRAPEVILGFLEDHRIDAWSTALVIFEMATNTTLFPAYYNNCVLYYQLCTLGNLDWSMVEQSRHGEAYFVGTSFLRQTGGKKRPKSFLVHTMHRNNRLRRTLFMSYTDQWQEERTGNQVINDRNKLEALHALLEQMLIMDPRHRLPIQFVPASEFMNYQFYIDS